MSASDDSSLLNALLESSEDENFELSDNSFNEDEERFKKQKKVEEYLEINFDDDEEDDNDGDESKEQNQEESFVQIKSPIKFNSIINQKFKDSPSRRIVKSCKRRAQKNPKRTPKKLQKLDDDFEELSNEHDNTISKVSVGDTTIYNVIEETSNDNKHITNGNATSQSIEKNQELLNLNNVVSEEEDDDDIEEEEEHDVRLISDDSLSEMELENEITEFPIVEDPLPIKYSIPQNLLSHEYDKIADNQTKGREIYEDSFIVKNGGDRNLTKSGGIASEFKPVAQKTASRRKALHVPKVDLDESNLYVNTGLNSIPKRPADNIELIECLSTYRILAKKLLEKINIPEMELMSETDDLINVYKLLRN
jgi:hypothetical protein